MDTALRLLMSDGAVTIAFRPKLTAEQYAELLRIADRAKTKFDLRTALEVVSKLWGRDVEFREIEDRLQRDYGSRILAMAVR